MAEINLDRLKSVLCYDESSKSGLQWLETITTGNPPRPLAKAGTEVGSISHNRYWEMGFDNKGFLVHRIVWALHNGEIPAGMVIDHIDGDGLNNRIENLRVVTQQSNMRNAKMYSSNKTGFVGVARTSKDGGNGKVYEYYTAIWKTIDGEQQRKDYSIEKLGESSAFLLAFTHRQGAMEDLHHEGAGYTKRHGVRA